MSERPNNNSSAIVDFVVDNVVDRVDAWLGCGSKPTLGELRACLRDVFAAAEVPYDGYRLARALETKWYWEGVDYALVIELGAAPGGAESFRRSAQRNLEAAWMREHGKDLPVVLARGDEVTVRRHGASIGAVVVAVDREHGYYVLRSGTNQFEEAFEALDLVAHTPGKTEPCGMSGCTQERLVIDTMCTRCQREYGEDPDAFK